MSRLICLAAVAFWTVLLSASDRSWAQRVEADLTTHAISVETDFAGEKVALFGAVGSDPEQSSLSRPDIIIVVRGPKETINVRRKQRIAGIWINADGKTFEDVPGYYTTITNRPIDEIASFFTLGELGIGVSSVKAGMFLASAKEKRIGTVDFIEALVRILGKEKLYQENEVGITFIGRHLFRAEFELPANVPIGAYEADVYLFRDGELLSRTSAHLSIEKSGLEQWIYSLAHTQPFLYGVLSVLAAMAAGLAASAIFRKK